MINGIKKFSTLDYPGKPAFVIFTGGCNFRCPFCHNRQIVLKESELIKEEDVFKMLKERRKLLDAVVITGGEPTIYGNKLIDLIEKIKAMGFLVKLDTNGTNPVLVQKLINKNLIDYIAMDLKGSFEKYSGIVGANVDLQLIKDSIALIEDSGIDYLFRTTVYKEAHSKDDILEISNYVKDKSKYFIQPYICGSEQLVDVEYTSYSEDELKNLANELKIEVNI